MQSTTIITGSRTSVQIPIPIWWASACQVPDFRKCLRAKVPVNNVVERQGYYQDRVERGGRAKRAEAVAEVVEKAS
jgi:hypothetical protein